MSVTTLSALGIAAFLLDVMYMAVILRRHIAGLGKGMHVIYVSALLIGLFLLFCITEVSRCVIAENEPSVFEAFASDVNALFCMGTEAVMTALWAVFWHLSGTAGRVLPVSTVCTNGRKTSVMSS